MKSNIKLKNNVLKDKEALLDNSSIKSSCDILVMESTNKWVFTKKELFKKDKNEKSDIITLDILSQFNESVSQSWSEFLYVWIHVESKKLLKLFINFFTTGSSSIQHEAN